VRQWAQRGNDIVYGRTIQGDSALLQRHANMLQTSPGELLSDVEWGRDLDSLLGSVTPDTRGLAAVSRAQHLKDPETQDADVEIVIAGGKLTYAVAITNTEGNTVVYEEVIDDPG